MLKSIEKNILNIWIKNTEAGKKKNNFRKGRIDFFESIFNWFFRGYKHCTTRIYLQRLFLFNLDNYDIFVNNNACYVFQVYYRRHTWTHYCKSAGNLKEVNVAKNLSEVGGAEPAQAQVCSCAIYALTSKCLLKF